MTRRVSDKYERWMVVLTLMFVGAFVFTVSA
jgi:hypothetical protein